MKLGKLLLVSMILLSGHAKIYAQSVDTTQKKAKNTRPKRRKPSLLVLKPLSDQPVQLFAGWVWQDSW